MWLIYRLSQEYSSYFRYELTVLTDLDGYTSEANAEELLFVKGKASGFYILKYRAGRNLPRLTLQVGARELKSSGGSQSGYFAFAASGLKDYLSLPLEGVEIETFLVDSLHIVLQKMASKKCKVIFKGTLSYLPQYTSFSPVIVKPDSVVLTGLERVLQAMDGVETQPVHLKNVDRDMQGVLGLALEEGVQCATKEIRYELQVSRFVEYKIQREISVKDIPDQVKVLLIPPQLTISFRAPYDAPERSFEGYIQPLILFSELEKAVSGKIIPLLSELPATVSQFEMDPPVVECIVQKLSNAKP
ncbi:MAG: hypothetical protein FWG54_04290 [Bacteroidetes bacterium]|nr:hypothetical protein [Bacteroidota bacterium]